MSNAWTLDRTIPSDRSVIDELISHLALEMAQREWLAGEVKHVRIAYEEAIVNAFVHGNKGIQDGSVHVAMFCDHEQVRIQITDQGPGFDPAMVPDPRRQELLEIPGGRGVFLIGRIMSEVFYNERGNQVTMIKNRGDNLNTA